MIRTLSDFGDYAVGWKKISACGFYVEELLNSAKNSNIDIWNLHRPDQYTVTFNIYSFSVEKLFELADSTRSLREMELKICETVGLIEDLLHYKLRSGLLVGFLFSVIVLVIMTSFIWKIEITGLTSVSEEVLLEALSDNGIFVGALTSGHDFQKIKYSIMHDFESIAYITVNMRGCKAEVEVTEGIIPPNLADPDPCNIFAERDGQIVLMETYQGIPQVKKYSAVRKGELLVSGVYNSNVIGYRLVHAEAKIMARTRRIYNDFCPLNSVELESTGAFDEFFELKLFGWSINLSFFNRVNYDRYELISEETELRIGENIVLPISLIKTVLYEQVENRVFYTENEAKAFIKASLDERIRIDLHGLEIEDIEESFTVTSEGVYGIYDMTVIEDICDERKIEVEIID